MRERRKKKTNSRRLSNDRRYQAGLALGISGVASPYLFSNKIEDTIVKHLTPKSHQRVNPSDRRALKRITKYAKGKKSKGGLGLKYDRYKGVGSIKNNAFASYRYNKAGRMYGAKIVANPGNPAVVAHEIGHIRQGKNREKVYTKLQKLLGKRKLTGKQINRLDDLITGRAGRKNKVFDVATVLAAVPLVSNNNMVNTAALTTAGALTVGAGLPLLINETGADARAIQLLKKTKTLPRNKSLVLRKLFGTSSYYTTLIPGIIGTALVASATRRHRKRKKK